MKLKIIVLLVLFSLNYSCKSQQYSIISLPVKQLNFGKGGGISGAIDTYILLENGQLFYTNSITRAHKEFDAIPKKLAKKYFVEFENITNNKPAFNHPGNVYYFIQEVNIDTTRIVWGNTNYEIDASYSNLYKNLREHLK